MLLYHVDHSASSYYVMLKELEGGEECHFSQCETEVQISILAYSPLGQYISQTKSNQTMIL
jgi:hypothetical protein